MVLSALLGAFSYTGGSLMGAARDPTVDEVSRKEYLRKNRRRPVEEIVNELGEGRGEWTFPHPLYAVLVSADAEKRGMS